MALFFSWIYNELSFILISGNFQEIFLFVICNKLNSYHQHHFFLKCNIDISSLGLWRKKCEIPAYSYLQSSRSFHLQGEGKTQISLLHNRAVEKSRTP